MNAGNSNHENDDGGEARPDEISGLDHAMSELSRRDFLNAGLTAAVLIALTGCASYSTSQSTVDRAITDLRNTIKGFGGDELRRARLASLARRIENRCRDIIADYSDFRLKMDTDSRRRETPSADLKALAERFIERRTKFRRDVFGIQDELRRELTKTEWRQVAMVLKSGADEYMRTIIERS